MKEGALRNAVFGVQDSLVSTVGLISGIASVGISRSALLLTGFVLVFVEAFSMAIGSFLSDVSAREYRERHAVQSGPSIFGGIVMLISYIVAGLIVLMPYQLVSGDSAFGLSIILSLITLFLLGIVSARSSSLPVLNRGIRMIVLGGLAILLGIGVAHIIS